MLRCYFRAGVNGDVSALNCLRDISTVQSSIAPQYLLNIIQDVALQIGGTATAGYIAIWRESAQVYVKNGGRGYLHASLLPKETEVVYAARAGDVARLSELLPTTLGPLTGIPVPSEVYVAIMVATMAGQLDALKELFKLLSPGFCTMVACDLFSIALYPHVVRFLLQHHGRGWPEHKDVFSYIIQGAGAAHMCLRCKRTARKHVEAGLTSAVVAYLEETEADVNSRFCIRLLHVAAKYNRYETVDALLRMGIPVDGMARIRPTERKALTPLARALKKRSFDAFKILKMAGGSVRYEQEGYSSDVFND